MSGKKDSGLVMIIFAIMAKSTKLLKVFKLFKVAKPMVMFFSMSVSAIAYAFWLGPWLAIIFIALLLIHEMGHVVAMRIKGYDTPTPVFIPFLGAAIFAPKEMDRNTEAFIGFGGPLLGSIGSLAVFLLWALSLKSNQNDPFAAVVLVGSYLGMYINLFNLIPISPLDGGRVTQAAGAWFKYLGLLGLLAFSLWFRQPVILYVWIIVLLDLYFIPLRMRAILISGAWVSMVVLMSLGYGDQPFWINVVDCIITFVFVIMAVTRAYSREDVVPDTRPELSVKQRIRWFSAYAGLAAALTALVIFQSRFLPHNG